MTPTALFRIPKCAADASRGIYKNSKLLQSSHLLASPKCRFTSLQHHRQLQHCTPERPEPKGNIEPPDFAFAFDIDGVLLRASKRLSGACKTLQFLHNHRIPFILLTNGGGKTEQERVDQLSEIFGLPLTVENFIQSHTPFQEMAQGSENYEPLKDKTVLVLGHDQMNIRKIADEYGFKHVVTPGDILVSNPSIWPFSKILLPHYKSIAIPLPHSAQKPNEPLKIDAIFVFADPHDWALDSQVVLDLLLSKQGILGTYSAKNGDKSLPNNGWQQDGQPKLIFSNPDLLWAAAYPLPRLGQGGFRSALEGIWREMTEGAELKKLVIGKPSRVTYSFAQKVLRKHRKQMLAEHYGSSNSKDFGPLRKVFMVGDNPESDIKGANDFDNPKGTRWESILLKTGVWQEGRPPKYQPKMICENVEEAVRWALKKEGFTYTDEQFPKGQD